MSPENRSMPPMAADVTASCLTLVLFGTNIWVDTPEPTWLTRCGVGLLLLAGAFIVIPFVQLRRYGKPREGEPFFATTQVADRGIYRIVRHPQYLGYTLLVLGFAARNPHPLILTLAAGATAFFYWQAVVEERFCRRQLGPDYDEYRKRVPRFNFLLGLFRQLRKV